MEVNKRVEKWLKDTSKTLNISNLGLTEWPDVLKGKEDLIVKLNCSCNALVAIPSLPKLIDLFCYNNALVSLPLHLPNLTGLICFDNALVSLPLNLPNLTILDCSNNALVSIPDLPNLTELFCYENKLTTIPKLPNLVFLNCHNNKLTSLPLCPKLTKLYCHNNKLTSLPLCPKLTELWYHDNAVVSLPVFPNLSYIVTFFFVGQRIHYYPFRHQYKYSKGSFEIAGPLYKYEVVGHDGKGNAKVKFLASANTTNRGTGQRYMFSGLCNNEPTKEDVVLYDGQRHYFKNNKFNESFNSKIFRGECKPLDHFYTKKRNFFA